MAGDKQQRPRKPRFDWKWVFMGVLFMVAGNGLAYWFLRPIFMDLIDRQDRLMTGAGLMGAVALTVYFLGGLLVGRMSHGHTVQEPAVAGVLGLAIVFVLQLFLGQVNVIGLVIGSPFCFGLAYIGGLLGERWQVWAQRRAGS